MVMAPHSAAVWLPSRQWRSAFPLKDDPLQALTADQRHKLDQLQRVLHLEKLWDDHRHDLYMLRRFLKARDWDIARAKQMWQEMLSFRANNRVDYILEEFHFKEHTAVQAVYPHGLHKVDKEGRPVLIYRFGCVDLEALDKVTTSQRLTTLHIQTYEYIIHSVLPACSVLAGRHLEKIVTLIDVAGVRMRDVGRILDMLSGLVKIDGNNYPETLGAMIIINAPMWFSGSFALIKRALSAETQKKVQILGSNYQSALHEAIPRENLLPEFGGCSSGTLGDALGPWHTTLEQMRLAEQVSPSHAPHKHKHDEPGASDDGQQRDGHAKRQKSLERGAGGQVSHRASAEHPVNSAVIVLHPPPEEHPVNSAEVVVDGHVHQQGQAQQAGQLQGRHSHAGAQHAHHTMGEAHVSGTATTDGHQHQLHQQHHNQQQQQGPGGVSDANMSIPLLSHDSSMYQSLGTGEQPSWIGSCASAEYNSSSTQQPDSHHHPPAHAHHQSAPMVAHQEVVSHAAPGLNDDSCQAADLDQESIPNAYLAVLQAAVPSKHVVDAPGVRLAGVASEPGAGQDELTAQLVTEQSQTLETMSIVSFESCRSVDSAMMTSPGSSLKGPLQLGGSGEHGFQPASPRNSGLIHGRSSARNLGRNSNNSVASQPLYDGAVSKVGGGGSARQQLSVPGAHPPPQQPTATSAVLSKLPKWLVGTAPGQANGAESANTPFLPAHGVRSDESSSHVAHPAAAGLPAGVLPDQQGLEGVPVEHTGPWIAIAGMDYNLDGSAGGAPRGPVLLPAHIPVQLVNGQSILGVIPGAYLALKDAPGLSREAAGALQAGTRGMHLLPDYVRTWLRGAGDALQGKQLAPNSSRQQLLDGVNELSSADVAAHGDHHALEAREAAVALLDPHGRGVRVPGGRRDGKSGVTMDSGMVGHQRAEQILAGHRRALSNVDMVSVADAVHRAPALGCAEGSPAGQAAAAKLPAGTYEVYVDSEDEEAGGLLFSKHTRPARYTFWGTVKRRLCCCF